MSLQQLQAEPLQPDIMDWNWGPNLPMTPPLAFYDGMAGLTSPNSPFPGISGHWPGYIQARFAEFLELMHQFDYQGPQPLSESTPCSPVSPATATPFPTSPISEIAPTPVHDCVHQTATSPGDSTDSVSTEPKLCAVSCTQCQSERRERRRAQNRTAQRKFRQRRETALEVLMSSINAKEEELTFLRESNESLLEQLNALRRQNARLVNGKPEIEADELVDDLEEHSALSPESCD